MPRENPRKRKRKAPGPQSKFTAAAAAKICSRIAAGATIDEAAKAGGLHRDTVYEWKATREAFAAQVEAAKEKRLDVLEERWTHATRKDWRAAQAMLRALRSKKYAERLTVHVESELEAAVARLREAFGDEPAVFERAIAAIAGSHSAAGAREASVGENREDDRGGQAVHPAPAV